jgi:hypothetical protein
MIKILIKLFIIRKRNKLKAKLKKKRGFIINEIEKTEKIYVDKLYVTY